MARLVIVAGPAVFPTLPILFHPIFIPNHRSTPHLRPGLSLWQVPPYNQHPLSTSIPSLYPTPVTPTVKARLVIVAGPALQPTPPLHFYPIFIPTLVFPTFKARLVIVAGPASSVSPHSFLSLTPLFSHLLLSSTPIIIPIIWPGLSLWQVPPCSPSNSPRTSTLLDSPFNTLSFLRPGLSLWQAPPPPFPLLTTSTPSITLIFHPF